MSWFDTSGLANIAKSALKEAQRTIDKALDIKDEDVNRVPVNTPIDTDSDDFFGTWGITHSGNVSEMKKATLSDAAAKGLATNSLLSTSLWGSFTGSFFDAQKNNIKTEDPTDVLDDSIDLGNEHFSSSKLVVQQNDECDNGVPHLSDNVGIYKTVDKLETNKPLKEVKLDVTEESNIQVHISSMRNPTAKSEPSTNSNRLSVISMESGKNSSESVEVLTNTSCTTSPDSETQSVEQSLSTSSSALGLKHASESVEVLPDSLTSPSSVEVLGSESNASHKLSQYTDEYLSPLMSPFVEDDAKPNLEKISPESVEVIPEDQEENSIAEDTMSYTSASESTPVTILECSLNQQKFLKEMNIKMEAISDGFKSDLSHSPDKNFAETITRAPSRTGMHLPLPQATAQLIDTQPQSSLKDISELLKNSNIIDIPQENETINDSLTDIQEPQLEDEGSHSDRTMIASDNLMESSSDTSTATDSNTNSTYLKNMLADAMTEKIGENDSLKKANHLIDLTQSMLESTQNMEMINCISITQLEMPPREASPLSSESRSDLVKVGSDHTSGHTSGDELETTTSSDIEIISSPNGDSSSTQSRQSPAKQAVIKNKSNDANVDILLGKMTFKKLKGHNRELSEASSVSDDSHSSETEKLIKRISEMTEILELREAKLIDINRRNVELQEVNFDLKRQLDVLFTQQIESADLSQLTEEYTQRLSALEKKFQQAIRDKDSLRKQLEQSKQEAATRLTKGELETVIAEKDETIKELREEGEKLSKQQLQHSNIIKKLRAKEKEQESTIKNLKESVEELTSEAERLKRSLTAKEEVERSQIEAVHQLTARNKKSEYQISQLQENVDDLNQKYTAVKKSFEMAKKELADKNKTSSELIARENMLQSLQNEKLMTESQNEEIINQLEDMRLKLQQTDQEYLKKEKKLRTENNELLRRIEKAEQRNEELAQSLLEVSKPLIRQIETQQVTYNMKITNYEKLEQGLLLKNNELHGKLLSLTENERAAREDCSSLRSKMSSLEVQLSSSLHQNDMLKVEIEQLKTENLIHIQDLEKQINTLQEQLKDENGKVENLTKEISSLQYQLSVEKNTSEAEKRKNYMLQEQVREKSDINTGRGVSPITGNTSPTLSVGRASLSESISSSSLWQTDEPFDSGPVPRYTNMFEMQMLQTNLKQREGEVQQLQWELNRREHERTLLNSEISELLTRVENLESKLIDHEALKTQLNDLQKQYDTLCQLYGEKVEEAEELKLDLEDVKDMYKTQIDELLRQQKLTC